MKLEWAILYYRYSKIIEENEYFYRQADNVDFDLNRGHNNFKSIRLKKNFEFLFVSRIAEETEVVNETNLSYNVPNHRTIWLEAKYSEKWRE